MNEGLLELMESYKTFQEFCPECGSENIDMTGGYYSQEDPHYFIETWICYNCNLEFEIK